MDNASWQFRVPDDSQYWVEMVKCQHACPVHTDACGYVTAIAEGRYEQAYAIARATNPFASICGRVCGAPCEANCRRGSLDEPVAIRALKRFVTDKFGPETGDYTAYRDGANQKMLPPNRGDYEKVAVIGGGVAGMTVAHDLVQIGYKVTVFEANAEPGGMLTAGVPVFRLPRELVRHEINAIVSLGVDLKCNMKLGRDFSIADLRAQGYKAIFLGVGLPNGRKLSLPGGEAEGVYDGMEFLKAFNEGKPLPLGRRVVVVGGGNVAYDVARSALRPFEALNQEDALQEMGHGEKVAYDVARSALRMSGDKEIHVVCLESLEEMPADKVEIHEGEEEGIHLHNRVGPKEIIVENGKCKGLRVVKCLSVFDGERRFNPKFDETDLSDIHADSVVFAIGQTSDLSFLKPEDGVETNRGLVKVDPATYQTTAPDIFACGDVAHGARLFIDAIASAHTAARSMHDFLRGTRTGRGGSQALAARRLHHGRGLAPRGALQRAGAGERGPRHFGGDRRAELPRGDGPPPGLPLPALQRQHGLRDGPLHRLQRLRGRLPRGPHQAGGHQHPLRLRRPRAAGGGRGRAQPGRIPGHASQDKDELGGVMLKDESTCIRCAMCASRCPTHAILMKRFDHSTECVSIPSPNPKILYNN
ncbi:MAG: FAD-dependent oxidoreductase [Holophagaceae bacterium]|nr:FAD-dependent oxidoreductase [Holophagaceae bacterium]